MREGMLSGSLNLPEPVNPAEAGFSAFDNIAFLWLTLCSVGATTPS
jgi:hypothetical protein